MSVFISPPPPPPPPLLLLLALIYCLLHPLRCQRTVFAYHLRACARVCVRSCFVKTDTSAFGEHTLEDAAAAAAAAAHTCAVSRAICECDDANVCDWRECCVGECCVRDCCLREARFTTIDHSHTDDRGRSWSKSKCFFFQLLQELLGRWEIRP